MKFSRKMLFMIALKVISNQGFTLSLQDKYLEKPQGGQIDPQVFLGLSFNICIHILHSFLNVHLFLSIILSNTARIVFESSCILKSQSLKVLNDSLIIILVLYPIVSMSTHANNNR